MENKNFAAGIASGNHVSGTPLTTDLAEKGSPSLMLNAIDRAVTKVRPMATPLDQISRLGHVRQADALEVAYYTADIRRDSSVVNSWPESSTPTDDGNRTVTVSVREPELFEPSETVMLTDADGVIYTAYITAKGASSTLTLVGDLPESLEEMGAVIVRMGRAATQLDVQSPQLNVLPRRSTNLCQIFKMQIEQSMVLKESHKEIGWDFLDQQEAAIYDMRLGMEKQMLFGHKMKVYDPVKQESVTLTEGIWNQAGKEIEVTLSTLSNTALVDMLRTAFTGNSGSRKKVLLAGSELIAALNKIESTKVITAMDQQTVWGIDFNVLCSKFGRLYVAFSEVFDVAGMASCGIIIDPEYIQKHVFIPFRADKLDLRGSGQRNTEAVVLTEASCLTLRYPQTHARVIGV